MKTYVDMVDAIAQLELPNMKPTPGLFTPHKMGGSSEVAKRRLSIDTPPRPQRRASFIDLLPFSPIHGSEEAAEDVPEASTPKATGAARAGAGTPTPTAQSFAAILATKSIATPITSRREPTPELDSSSDTGTESTAESEDVFSDIHGTASKGRRIKEGLVCVPCSIWFTSVAQLALSQPILASIET